jgi:hypothetical protein
LIKSLLKNKKGTAEVIGTVMFIVILLFFFTNVYLWHDAATKEMNDLYVKRINSPITITVSETTLTVTNEGGESASLSRLWVNEKTPGSLDPNHQSFDLGSMVVGAGSTISIPLNQFNNYDPPQKVTFKVVTTVGNIASFDFTR